MKWKPWVVGLFALVVFDTALVFAVKAYWRNRAEASAGPAVVAPSAIAPALSSPAVPPVPPPLQQACINGATWVYNDRWQRWFKLSPPVACKLGTVRSENDREGLIVRHPKGWRPHGGHNLTQ